MLKPNEVAKIGLKETPQQSDVAIAQRLNISKDTVRRAREHPAQNAQVARIGSDGIERKLPEPKELTWSPEKDAELMRLRKEGKGDQEISEILGTTRGAVSGRYQRIMTLHPDLTARRLPPKMPEDILWQIELVVSPAKARMYEVDTLTSYVDQMSDDMRQLIAAEVEVVYNLSRDIIKRLVGGTRNIRPIACGTEIKLEKE
jgi:DNA-binding CsgD family transcriptional regulator